MPPDKGLSVTPEMVDAARDILMRSGEIRSLPHYRVQAALEVAIELQPESGEVTELRRLLADLSAAATNAFGTVQPRETREALVTANMATRSYLEGGPRVIPGSFKPAEETH